MNEGLFLALAVATLWAIERGHWWRAGLLGALAALTRQQGLALARGVWRARYDALSVNAFHAGVLRVETFNMQDTNV